MNNVTCKAVEPVVVPVLLNTNRNESVTPASKNVEPLPRNCVGYTMLYSGLRSMPLTNCKPTLSNFAWNPPLLATRTITFHGLIIPAVTVLWLGCTATTCTSAGWVTCSSLRVTLRSRLKGLPFSVPRNSTSGVYVPIGMLAGIAVETNVSVVSPGAMLCTKLASNAAAKLAGPPLKRNLVLAALSATVDAPPIFRTRTLKA